MKQIIVDGRIGKDAEVLTTRTGKKYVRFSLANDTFTNGTNKTEWFDVTSYDPYVVENRVKLLTKGRYVIVSGTLNTEVNTKNGKLYLNQYVTAVSIETPSFGTKREENEETVSTYTAGTPSTMTKPVEQPKPVEEVKQPEPVYSYSAAGNSLNDMSDDDDLPF